MNPSLPTRTETAFDLVTNLLDRGYIQAAGATINAITASVNQGLIPQRLRELDAEAARLSGLGQRLSPDNPVMRALLADFDDILRQNANLLRDNAPNVQQAGTAAAAILTRQLALPGLNDEQLAAFGVAWNIPDPETVNALVGYATSPEWEAELNRYQENSAGAVLNLAVRGFIEGWNPLTTARRLHELIPSIPVYQANTMLRTLQLQSYRDATTAHQVANADILDGVMRIGVLDNRICLACLAEHGTIHPVGTRILDHHNGRCIGIGIVRGRQRQIVTGEQYYAGLPIDQQRLLAGPANYEALRQGRVQMRDFVDTYHDPVFGEMLREASLKKILGDGAAEFYTHP